MAWNDLQNTHIARIHTHTRDMVSGQWPMYTKHAHTHKERERERNIAWIARIHANDTTSALTNTKTRRINYIERERIFVNIKNPTRWIDRNIRVF